MTAEATSSGRVHAVDSPLLLWGLADRHWDLALTLLTALILAISRFALLASGPWEWDETIFARGMLHFELAAHFPQPPGFPGLLALGHLLLPFAGTPYQALQWLSAIASTLCLWPLAALGRRVASPPVAAAAALLVLFLPGPWLYSVRGFSSTAAAVFAFAAAAVWAGDLDGRRLTAFTLLVTAAFLVRPILLPSLALLWLAGVSTVRPLRRILPGLTGGAALVGVAVAVMVHLEGGWSAFIQPFVVHADFHTARLHRNTEVVADIGLIKGVGGAAVAAGLVLTSLLGLAAWARRVGARSAAAWLLIVGITVAQLVMLQNRSYARYGVVVQMAAAPLLAGAATLLSPPVGLLALLGLAGTAAWSSYPLLEEQHSERFGPWQATVDAARIAGERNWAVVVEPEVHVFSSYWWYVLEWRGATPPPMVLSPRAPEPWLGVDRPWLAATVHPHLYLPSLTGRSTAYGGVSQRLEPMTQSRFLSADLIENPPLPVGSWWTRESLPDGRSFMWAGPEAELWLPPVPEDTLLGLALRPAPGDTPVKISVAAADAEIELDGTSSTSWLWLRTARDEPLKPVIVRLERSGGFPPGGGDCRPLAVQLLGVVLRPRGAAFGGAAASDTDRRLLRLEVDGRYDTEDFGALGRGVWLMPEARLRLALDEAGRLLLRLAAPRPTPPRLLILIAGEIIAGPLDLEPGSINRIAVDIGPHQAGAGVVELELLSEPYVPAAAGTGTDSRALGVVLLGLDFKPSEPTKGWWSLR